MPNFNGSGPNGTGMMTGRGLGPCAGAQAMGPDCGRGRGAGDGRGAMFRGSGSGRRQRMGWLAVGYGQGGEGAAAANVRLALKGRKAFLLAELARTEALLGEDAAK